ncbi:MAG: hypothetical protein HY816_05535 [Candidatus Wallbacteria bacterium]|nr:hypothetical protein [Candidatus Wallbacteria bacterium]
MRVRFEAVEAARTSRRWSHSDTASEASPSVNGEAKTLALVTRRTKANITAHALQLGACE